MLGAGLGTAAGLITSGAISRAIDRQKAEKELDAAKKGKSAKGNDTQSKAGDNSGDKSNGGDKTSDDDPFVQDINDDGVDLADDTDSDPFVQGTDDSDTEGGDS